MRIAVFGYYHHLNYGDDRLGQALVHALYPHTTVLLPHNQDPPPLDWFDFILVGGGGLVWERVGIWRNIKHWLIKNKKPFGVVGLGINEINDDLKSDLLWMAENAKLFVVRDNKSHQLLDYHSKVKVLPDLTWMIPYPYRIEGVNRNSVALNLASKHPQGYDPIRWGKVIQNTVEDLVPFPLRFGKNHDSNIFQTLGFKNCPNEFSINPLYDCSYLIGTRFHSIVFALQVGIPFVAVLYDDKVRRLLEDNNMTDLAVETFDYLEIVNRFQYLKDNTDTVKERINKVNNKLIIGGKELHQLLSAAIHDLSQLNLRKSPPVQALKKLLHYR